MTKTYVIGDIHGWREKLEILLVDRHLVTDDLQWQAGLSRLVFVGDYFNRGPDGIGTVDLVMRLQKQAVDTGGQVIALLGNHDVLLLAAHFFKRDFRRLFYKMGGTENDLNRLTPAHIEWLTALPALVMLDNTLFTHADTPLYNRYGASVDAVNSAFVDILSEQNYESWDNLLDDFSGHRTFLEMDVSNVNSFLHIFGAKWLIHGHTPIHKMTGQTPEDVKEAFVYADGLCINVDHCLYDGGEGFIYII